eukprot:c13083_g1_i1.p1 GENE.c13083_g1_i1~~c13083_g1_i1.p1  ORF type:complete len:234 (-),score=16.81 c13083_g1_i1:207-908(-)
MLQFNINPDNFHNNAYESDTDDEWMAGTPQAQKTPRPGYLRPPAAPQLSPLPPPAASFFTLRLSPNTRGVQTSPQTHSSTLANHNNFDTDLADVNSSRLNPSPQIWLDSESDCTLWSTWDQAYDSRSTSQGYQMTDFCDQKGCLPPKSFSKVSRSTHSGEEACCSICLDSIRESNHTAKLPCGHTFHDSCMKRCMKFATRCPNCRLELSEPDSHKHQYHHDTPQYPSGGILFL